MNQNFNLEEYLSGGVERLVKDAIKGTLKNPRESMFLTGYSVNAAKAAKLRHLYEQKGEHIPAFLIASITNVCNLQCTGCYARANSGCSDREERGVLTKEEWGRVFKEARELGISFILLAGGEPLVRRDIIEQAARYKEIIFPVFTNGTIIEEEYLTLLDHHRNLLPVLSMEGEENTTDSRRGKGIYQKVSNIMLAMKKKGILFGTSITVTKENKEEVTSADFLAKLKEKGCRLVFYVEYVPVSENTEILALEQSDRVFLDGRLNSLRESFQDMIFISFPGDEEAAGGCLAAGRGFFHINARGGAEPCPFSPYSDCNVKETGLREALKSPLFGKIKEKHGLLTEHIGGCTLFDQKDFVESLL
ncbi:radical SAM protein [Anaerocolumna sp. AGMB13020]|uniref:radical SAM protein n=1 Tax=Anaerocolumna sp. AGMB13020 TaxID=3081750 RepID=UPI002954C442|nr:radical SAM protein [Anaerocolumna sp. AGMB13020]WOO36820.1 radical SAM protein [Anaerocolumna sp. AGMB13020]